MKKAAAKLKKLENDIAEDTDNWMELVAREQVLKDLYGDKSIEGTLAAMNKLQLYAAHRKNLDYIKRLGNKQKVHSFMSDQLETIKHVKGMADLSSRMGKMGKRYKLDHNVEKLRKGCRRGTMSNDKLKVAQATVDDYVRELLSDDEEDPMNSLLTDREQKQLEEDILTETLTKRHLNVREPKTDSVMAVTDNELKHMLDFTDIQSDMDKKK